MTLSDLTVRQAKAAEKTYSIPDTDGLGLVVASTGGKSWHLRYYWLGKQKRISLGNYPEIGLREARTLRDEARALLAEYQRYAAYSNAQAAWGRVYNSVGLDVLPETIESHDVKTLAAAIEKTTQEWQSVVFKRASGG